VSTVAYPAIFVEGVYASNFFDGGVRAVVQQIQLRTEGGENGDLRVLVPWSEVPLVCK
jgi:hypothetical protein